MIFLKLILAHLLGDFIFQPDRWVENKNTKRIKSPYLYAHIFIHTALAFLVLWNLKLWFLPLIIGFSHYLIDLAKLYFQNSRNKKWLFFLDQLLHLVVIVAIVSTYNEVNLEMLKNPNFLKYITAALFLTTPASIVIKNLLASWSPVSLDHSKLKTESLVHAGKYIGILERLLVFIFIVINHWEGVGFMIAAKSVFRFSDLAEAKQRKLTEYVLIGTLLSFGLAILTGIITNIF